MPRRVQAPDGTLHEFPDDATDREISEALAAPPKTARGAAPERTWADTAADVGIGAAKGLGNTVTGLGELAYRYLPGVSAASDAVQRAMFGNALPAAGLFQQARRDLQPTNTPQTVGFMGEQIGEFLVPTGAVTRAAKAGVSGGLTLAQSGSPTTAAISAGLTAAVPGGGATKRAAKALKSGAEKNVAQALGATTKDLKKTAMEIAPEMLRRGVRGSREAMRDLAEATVDDIGAKIGAAVDDAAQAGKTLGNDILRGNIQFAKDAVSERLPKGGWKVIPGYERVAKQLDVLDEFVAQLPPDIPFDQAHRLKIKWDAIVDAAGLYGTKGLTSAADKSRASAFKQAADAFRSLLNDGSPTLAELNKEFGFWKALHNVTNATTLRTQAQTGGLIRAGTAAAGAASGFASGDTLGESLQRGALGGLLGAQFVQLVQSPAWRTTVTAPMKHRLAEALASGNAERIQTAVGRILAATPAQVDRRAPAY